METKFKVLIAVAITSVVVGAGVYSLDLILRPSYSPVAENVPVGSQSALSNVPSIVNQKPSEQQAANYEAYDFTCLSGKNIWPDRLTKLNDLLKANGLDESDVRLCTTGVKEIPDLAVVVSKDQSNVSLALVDYAKNSLRRVNNISTSEMFGTSVIGDILEWTPTTITFAQESLNENICSDNVGGKGTVAYQIQDLMVNDGTVKTLKTCTYVSCGVLSCSEK